MRKSVLLSKQPQIVANVLNENSKLLVCKQFPADYVGWVYIYCTKDKQHLKRYFGSERFALEKDNIASLNGKVVARFWCSKVEVLFDEYDCYSYGETDYDTQTLLPYEVYEKSCLSREEIENYLGKDKTGYAIHISKLEIFDRPKKLSEFYSKRINCDECDNSICGYRYFYRDNCYKVLLKAPQNYCYIEGEE